MEDRPRMPQLALPFALVGAAGGWLTATLFDNPLLHYTPSRAAPIALACTGVFGALVGARLTRNAAPELPWVSRTHAWLRLLVTVLAGGAASGASVGAIAFRTWQGTTSGFAAGLFAALLFLPACVAVLAAGRRAARARLGSLVAGSDRRVMWGILLAVLSINTLMGAADWLLGDVPWVALALTAVAFLGTLALLLLDLRALGRVAVAAREGAAMEVEDAGQKADREAEGAEVPSLDLGLGDDVRAQVKRGGAAYRARERAVALLVGSPEEARAALRGALVTKVVGLAVVCLTLGAHAFVARREVGLAFHQERCAFADNQSCRIAAERLESLATDPTDRVLARQYREWACDAYGSPDAASCAALADSFDAERKDLASAEIHRERACLQGHTPSCRLFARHLLERYSTGSESGHARSILWTACQFGDTAACVDRHLREP